MQGVDRSQTSSVRQLCEWFESRGQHQRWDRERPVRMDGSGARIEPAPVEEIRAKFLHNLQMFEQKHVSLAQRSGVVFHGSSPALHETANSTLSCPPGPSLSQTTTASVGKARRKTESYLKDVSRKAPHPGSSQLQTSSLSSGHGSPCVLLTDSSGTTSPVSGNVAAAASDLAKGAIPATRSRNCSQCAQHPTHQPVIRERVKSVAEREEKNSSGHGRKKPLLRVLSSQSGLGSRLRMVGAKKSHFEATSIPQKPSGEKDRTERHSQPYVEHSLSERQDLLQPHSVWYGSGDITNEPCPSAHRSRLVSTASIQLKKHSQPVIRKRSSSEERRISVIQTSKCFPETLTKPSPMLDEWLSSLVKQARVQPQEEDVECEDEPLPIRQHAYMSSENSWPYTKKLGSQKRLSGKDSDRNRTSERRDSSGLPSEGCEFSSGTSVCSDPSSSLNAASGEHMLHRRTSKDNVYPKKFERDKSEEKMSPQNSVTGAIGVASRVTEEDEDSACVQSMSDSASVQLCVPISEDPATFPRQHLPLSPCSSLGSYHSAMSSNADSAVDMALPDDETLEVEVSQEGHLDSAVKLKQILFACSLQCSSSSTTTSSSCLTIADSSFALKSSIEPASLSKDVNSILELPSFLISDHSSVECSAEDCESSRPEEDLTDSCQVLEPWGRLPRSPSATSSSSEGSYCSTCWTDSSVSDNETPATKRSERRRKQSSWKKIRSIIRWSPFIQVFKKHRYPWIQLAGHQGNFQAGEAGSVLKKLDSREHQSFQRLMNDRLQPYVPEFRGVVEKNGERYVQLQDLLCEFSSPCVMDIKMGVRTYLEEELTKARKKPTMRKDMYQKMVDVDSNAPTAEEHAQRAVTKPRYMQWRDQMSSSVDLGFRIEGIKKSDGASSKDFKKTKSRDSVADILKAFIGDDEIVLAKYLKRLREISATQESSEFFQSHEVVGSSLLFVHDGRGEVNVWMIDFGKTEPLPKGVVINHRATWVEGNHEDGYLFGLDNIISMLEEMQASSMV